MSKPEWFDGAKNPPKVGEWIWWRFKSDSNPSLITASMVEACQIWHHSFWTPAPAPPEFVVPEPPMPEVARCKDHPTKPATTAMQDGVSDKIWHRVGCSVCGAVAIHTDKVRAILGWNAMQGA